MIYDIIKGVMKKSKRKNSSDVQSDVFVDGQELRETNYIV